MTDRFPDPVRAALEYAGWRPGRWEIKQAEAWADELAAFVSPDGHRHNLFPAAVEAWAEFGGLRFPSRGTSLPFVLDPLTGIHLPRTLDDLGRALGTVLAPLGEEAGGAGYLAIDSSARVYSIDHVGEWYWGSGMDAALTAILTPTEPTRL